MRVAERSIAVVVIVGFGVAAAMGPMSRSTSAAKEATSFSEDVAPIIFKHCTECHRPGEAAPFSLMTYQDVRAHGRLIASVIASRRMPPWKAAPADYPIKNERRLSDGDIATIQEWVAAQMPEGDRS